MIRLKGSIGYTLFEKKNGKPKNILVFADSHNKLPYCEDSENMSNFLKNKQTTNNILLEEVLRTESIKLEELWPDSPHTQLLKKYYLEDTKNCNNKNCIKPIDIRPFLIVASLDYVDDKITLKEYLININNFFEFKNNIFIKVFKNLYSNYFFSKKKRLLVQFYLIKKDYLNFINNNDNIINKSIKENKNKVENDIIKILCDIMEFYIILKLYVYRDRNSIIHIGKYHYDKIIFWLKELYGYKIIKEFNDDMHQGCINIHKNII
jgi:hypothetical protein